jgi:hypothetical protein
MAVAEVKYSEKKRTLKGTGADDVINAPITVMLLRPRERIKIKV